MGNHKIINNGSYWLVGLWGIFFLLISFILRLIVDFTCCCKNISERSGIPFTKFPIMGLIFFFFLLFSFSNNLQSENKDTHEKSTILREHKIKDCYF